MRTLKNSRAGMLKTQQPSVKVLAIAESVEAKMLQMFLSHLLLDAWRQWIAITWPID
jgi:hypothetical protein